MPSRRSTLILPTQHPTTGTTFITDCRSTKHLDHIPDPVTKPGSIGGGSRHECPVCDNFHDICNGRCSPLDGRRSNAALHMERIKQRSDRPLSPSARDEVNSHRTCCCSAS